MRVAYTRTGLPYVLCCDPILVRLLRKAELRRQKILPRELREGGVNANGDVFARSSPGGSALAVLVVK
jgi:hypothetical protein